MTSIKLIFTIFLLALLAPVMVTMALLFRDAKSDDDETDVPYLCIDCVEMKNGGWHCATCEED